uniref:Uncharacterized protein n=1 Tax=Physcomitrium patens TaxID=3218 RepID=A0A2K1KUQ7_PHYPA|nr:hypothetical protein PHYPA_004516 [Physcomitrium patens]
MSAAKKPAYAMVESGGAEFLPYFTKNARTRFGLESRESSLILNGTAIVMERNPSELPTLKCSKSYMDTPYSFKEHFMLSNVAAIANMVSARGNRLECRYSELCCLPNFTSFQIAFYLVFF